MDINYDIIIIGTGWYGCYIASKLQDNYKILIIEKSSDIFNGSSFYNQNRLHLGYHYARDYGTRNLCHEYYERFKQEYEECIDDVKDNYYAISNESILCGRTYLSIFRHEDFEFIHDRENKQFTNIHCYPIKVNEKVINSKKAKKLMKTKLTNCKFLFDTEVTNIIETERNIIINNQYECRILLDCTYNQMELVKENYKYEVTLSLLYNKIKEFGAITIVDGNFCSLYPRDGNIYSLTDVEYTPIITSNSFAEIKEYKPTEEQINELRIKMEEKMSHYFSEFLDKFEYLSYFLSFKTKIISCSDSRNISITKCSDRILSVNCGKIYGIFEWEKYVMKFLIENSSKFD